MQLIQQILFTLLAAIGTWLFSKKIMKIRRNILLGKEEIVHTDNATRWKNLTLLALGQKKMFKKPLVAAMHLVVYLGFIIINIEVLEIVLDGITGQHRIFAGVIGTGLYNFLINSFELLAIGVWLVCVVFLVRRNILKIRRFISHDLDGWPRSDANYILITEILLMTFFLTMNGCDSILNARNIGHYSEHPVGPWVISHLLNPILNGMGDGSLVMLERSCWWLHILGIFAFLNYLPYSKHLHVLLAFPNAYFARPEAQGKMNNMPEIQKEVILAMGGDIASNP